MKLGCEAMEALKSEITGLLLPGDELVVAGPVGLFGTSVLTKEKYDFLRKYFSANFLFQAENLRKEYGVGKEPMESQAWKMAEEAGASALHAMGEGGFLAALWKMAEASQVGLNVDFHRIPIRQETIEICERFDLNPYRLHAEGTLLVGISSGESLVQEYRRMGLEACVIGQTNDGNDRLLYAGENARYLERPMPDELWKSVPEKKYFVER